MILKGLKTLRHSDSFNISYDFVFQTELYSFTLYTQCLQISANIFWITVYMQSILPLSLSNLVIKLFTSSDLKWTLIATTCKRLLLKAANLCKVGISSNQLLSVYMINRIRPRAVILKWSLTSTNTMGSCTL